MTCYIQYQFNALKVDFEKENLHFNKCKKTHLQSLLPTAAMGPGSILCCLHNLKEETLCWFLK